MRVIKSCLALLFAVVLFASCTPEAYFTADQINSSRAQYGLAPLEFNAMLHFKAQAWAEQLQRQGYLSHSRLTDGNHSTTWTILGENVGYTWHDLGGMHQLFMNSVLHRNNILGPFNKVGTGVVAENTPYGVRYWVVQEFMWEYYQG